MTEIRQADVYWRRDVGRELCVDVADVIERVDIETSDGNRHSGDLTRSKNASGDLFFEIANAAVRGLNAPQRHYEWMDCRLSNSRWGLDWQNQVSLDSMPVCDGSPESEEMLCEARINQWTMTHDFSIMPHAELMPQVSSVSRVRDLNGDGVYDRIEAEFTGLSKVGALRVHDVPARMFWETIFERSVQCYTKHDDFGCGSFKSYADHDWPGPLLTEK